MPANRGSDDRMPYVEQMKLFPGMTISQLATEMEKAGVLGAGRLGKAVKTVTEMFRDRNYTRFLALAGPMVASGLRQIVCDLIQMGYIHGIITTGANITHDLIEAYGYKHEVGTSLANDEELKRKGVGRIYDIYIREAAFRKLEKETHRILADISEEKRRNIATYELLWEIGKRLKDRNSILKTAENKKVPILSPAIQDSMLGIHLWTFSQLHPLTLNPLLDFNKLTDMLFAAKKSGAIIVGGGVPKHHILAANMLRGGVDAAIQITFDRPEAGGLSGAPLEEAISWRKVRSGGKLVTVIGDATILFPIIMLAAIEKTRQAD